MSYCCHYLLTEIDNFYDPYNLEGPEMKFYALFTESNSHYWNVESHPLKDNFQHFGNMKGHEIIILAHFVEKKGNF